MFLKTEIKITTHNIRIDAIQWQIHYFLFEFDGNSNVYSVSPFSRCLHITYNPKFDLANEGQGQGREKRDLCYSTGNVRFYIGDFFQNFGYVATNVYAKGHTHTHTRAQTYIHSERQG